MVKNHVIIQWKEGKRVKRCPRCQIYTEKNEGCNHMTCVNCKCQRCWLCEGEFKYGLYDSGKCSGQKFAIADYPNENFVIENNNNNYNNNFNDSSNFICDCDCHEFGLHKIFKPKWNFIKRDIS